MYGEEHHRPGRQELDDAADRRDFLGEVERVTHNTVYPRGDELTRLGHDAKRAAELYQYDDREPIADEYQDRRHDRRGQRELATRKKNDRRNEKCPGQRGDPRFEAACLANW